MLVPALKLADEYDVTTEEIHADEELLDDYVMRRCDDYARAAVSQHLAECSICLAAWIELVELRAVLAVIRQ